MQRWKIGLQNVGLTAEVQILGSKGL